MAAPLTYLSFALAFLITLFTLPRWINLALKLKFTGMDMNKHGKHEVSEAGGVCVILGFIFGFFLYIAFMVFYYGVDLSQIIFSFGAVSTLLLAGAIGFIDDILGWRIGMRKMNKVILTLLIPLPIMVINAGESVMRLPFIGAVDFGILFPLVLVPIAIIGTTNGFNMLAGYNGLEAGLGAIILSALGILSYIRDYHYAAAMCAIMVVALIAFLFYNFYPAKVFPGDTLTYSVGALIGIIAVLANTEKLALIMFIPYFLELILKGRERFDKASWAKSDKNGNLKNKYGKWYGLPNVAISFLNKFKGSAKEKEVVVLIWMFELLFVGIAFLTYGGYLAI